VSSWCCFNVAWRKLLQGHYTIYRSNILLLMWLYYEVARENIASSFLKTPCDCTFISTQIYSETHLQAFSLSTFFRSWYADPQLEHACTEFVYCLWLQNYLIWWVCILIKIDKLIPSTQPWELALTKLPRRKKMGRENTTVQKVSWQRH